MDIDDRKRNFNIYVIGVPENESNIMKRPSYLRSIKIFLEIIEDLHTCKPQQALEKIDLK